MLWLREAPVGIEPTNGGFAVLRELLRGSASLPNVRPARALRYPATSVMFRLFAFFCGRTFPRPSHHPTTPTLDGNRSIATPYRALPWANHFNLRVPSDPAPVHLLEVLCRCPLLASPSAPSRS